MSTLIHTATMHEPISKEKLLHDIEKNMEEGEEESSIFIAGIELRFNWERKEIDIIV